MNVWTLATAAAAVAGLAVGALVRAQSGGPPVIGPAAPPELTPSTSTPAVIGAPQVSGGTPELTMSTGVCGDVVGQLAAELAYWRDLASRTPLPPPTLPPPLIDTKAPLRTKATPTSAGPSSAPGGPSLVSIDPGSLPAVGVVAQPGTGSVLDRPRLAQVAALVKDMKPREAALVVAGLEEELAVGLLARMSPRSGSAITAALPPELASKLLTRLSQLPVPPPELP